MRKHWRTLVQTTGHPGVAVTGQPNKLQPLPHYPQGQFHSIDEAVQAANVKDTTVIRLQDVIPLPKIAVKVKVIEPS